MEIVAVLIFVLVFFRFIPAARSERSAVLALAQDILWSATVLALVGRLTAFGLEVILLSA